MHQAQAAPILASANAANQPDKRLRAGSQVSAQSQQGAATSVWCPANTQLQGRGGGYCEDADIAYAVAADSAEDFGVRGRGPSIRNSPNEYGP